MPNSETTLQHRIMLAASQAGLTMWRNNTGMAWQGREMQRLGSDVLLIEARPVRFGLAEGSSDLIGLQPIIITDEMIGRAFARFVAIEVKAERGRTTKKQQHFIEFIRQSGGIAIVARQPEDIIL